MHSSRLIFLGIVSTVASLTLAGCSLQPTQPNMPNPIDDPQTVLTPSVEPTSSASLSVEEALAIARSSECGKAGQISSASTYNPYSKTWWFELDAKKPGCNPACVVDEATKTATINWRCTGALPPEQKDIPTEQ